MNAPAPLMAGKRGLVMGVANDRSIAWAIARAVHAHGGEVALTYQGEALKKRVAPLAEQIGCSHLLPCDVTDEASLDAVFTTLDEAWGRLDYVVHAIAYSDKEQLKGRYVDTTAENFGATMQVSCFSFTSVCQRAERLLKAGGSLLTLTYMGAERVMPHYNVMGVAKAALEASVRYLAEDLGRQAIRVNALSAGPIKTLAASGIGDFRYILKWNQFNAPLRRNVTLDEVGGAGLYLLSDLSTGVTGEVHYVDCGYNVVGMLAPDAAQPIREMLEGFRRNAPMSGNGLGTLFRVTSFGESHGPSIGCVVDGCPPRLPLTEADIQVWLDRRRPGQSRFTTQRREPDRVQILSGVFEGLTTGTPIGLLIVNEDARSKDYSEISHTYRPGHADFTYQSKYGIRDYRGGGRSSARETAMRVAAGAIARRVLGEGVRIRGALVQVGPHAIDRARWDWDEVERNPFWSPDAAAAGHWAGFLDDARKNGSSAGGIVEVVADGVPVGLGAPVFDRLDADLAKALMSIPAVKGVEIGAGFAAAAMSGPEHNDRMRMRDGRVAFLSNNSGGVLGGISTGEPIIARLAVKPTSSVLTPQPTVTAEGADAEIATKGRHDPCVAIRAVPVAEAMVALTLADHLLRHRAQCGW